MQVLFRHITDHYPTCVSIPVNSFNCNKYKENNTIINKIINLINIINKEKMLMILNQETWTNVYSNNNVNESYFEFYKIISNALNCSTISKVVNSINKRLKEWITLGLLKSTRQALSLKCKKKTQTTKS